MNAVLKLQRGSHMVWAIGAVRLRILVWSGAGGSLLTFGGR